MKNIPAKILAGSFMLLTAAAKCPAAVITNDAALLGSGSTKTLHLTQSIPVGQGAFMFQVQQLAGSDYQFTYFSIAEQCALFEVSPGVSFDVAYVASHAPFVENDGDPGTATTAFAPGDIKYFGYWDDRSIFNGITGDVIGGPDESDLFGWVCIQQAGSTLIVQSSATALGGGIITGTVTQIPEPSSAALLFGFSAISLACGRRRARS